MNQTLRNKIEFVQCFAINPQLENFELHVHLNINPKLPEHMFVNKCQLPYGTGKNVKILAFTNDLSRKDQLIAAGADYISNDEIIQEIKKGKIFFDYCVATPESMKLVSPLARILGPRGLVPNQKLGTLDNDLVTAIKRLKSGNILLKNDRYGIIHTIVSKCTSPADHTLSNIEELLNFVNSKKPASIKGTYIKSVYLSSTMGPSVRIDI